IGQAIPLTGVTIVATPQDVAVDIAVKALQMFRQLNVTVLCLIENMSWFTCADCGKRHHPFGHGGAERAAVRCSVPFLGALPLDTEIRIKADKATTSVVPAPVPKATHVLNAIACQLT